MKQYIFSFITLAFVFLSCNNSLKKEIAEVEGLITMVDEIEKTVLSIDTSLAFTAKRQMTTDIKEIEQLSDTLDRETAFKLDEFFSGKKVIYRFHTNYNSMLNQIDFAKKQLSNLKEDLNNDLIDEKKFKDYYTTEHASIMELNMQVNKSVAGIDEAIQKYGLYRKDIDILKEKMAKGNTNNE